MQDERKCLTNMSLLGNQGSTASADLPVQHKRVVAAEENKEQGKTSAPSKHSRFTWFGLQAYVHGGKGGVYSLPVRRDYMLQRYRHSFIAEESLIDSNSQTWHPGLRSP